MSVNSKQIVKNTYYFTLANIFQKIIAFFYFAYISKLIGPDNLGKYTYALSFTTMFAILVDIGFEKMLIRECAKNKDNAQEYFSNILGIKIPLSLLTLATIFIITYFQSYPLVTKHLIYLSAFLMCLDSFNLTIECVLRGFHNLKYESLSVILCQFSTLIIGIGGILLFKDIKILIIALIAGSLTRFSIDLFSLIKTYNIYPKIKYNNDVIRKLIKITIPFTLAGIFLKIYSYADAVLLYNFKNDQALGFYSLPYRATNAFQFIPMAFTAAIFPALSYFYANSRDIVKKIYEELIVYLVMISIPVSFGIIALAKEIILKFFGNAYLPSVLALQILMCNLTFLFLDIPTGSLLNACDREKINTSMMGIAMTLNIISNFILIPKLSYIGASISMIVSSLFLVISKIYYAHKHIKFNFLKIMKGLLKAFIAGAAMFLAVIYFKYRINFYFVILSGAVIYAVALFLLGGIRKKDFTMIAEAMRHKV
ncbi:MAG: flippase [bacterium]